MTNHSDNNGSKQTKNAVFTRLLIAGTSACIADAATFPFDTAKVRLQLQGETTTSNTVQTVHQLRVNKSNKLLNSSRKRSVVSINTKNNNNAFTRTSGRGFISMAFPIPAKTVETITGNPSIEKTNAIATKPILQYRGLFGTITTIARQEGARSLYNGKIYAFPSNCVEEFAFDWIAKTFSGFFFCFSNFHRSFGWSSKTNGFCFGSIGNV